MLNRKMQRHTLFFFHSDSYVYFLPKHTRHLNSWYHVPYFCSLNAADYLKHRFGFLIAPRKSSQKFQKDADQQVVHVNFINHQLTAFSGSIFIHPFLVPLTQTLIYLVWRQISKGELFRNKVNFRKLWKMKILLINFGIPTETFR